MQITAASLPAIARYRWEYSGRKGFKFLFFALRDYTLLVLEYKVVATDHDFVLADMGCNSVCNDIVNLRVHLLVDKSALSGGRNNRVRHGVREVLL